MGMTSINDENRMILYIQKNNIDEREVTEWKWTEDSDPPGDIECTCILELNENDTVRVQASRAGPNHNIDTLNSRSALEFDVIKAAGTPPVLADVRIRTNTISDADTEPGVATAQLNLLTDGDVSTAGTAGPGFQSDEWHVSNPSGGIGSSFQARMTQVLGSLDVGVTGVWQTISSTRSYGITRNVAGAESFTGLLEIRDVATMTVQDSATITLSVNILPLGK